MTVVVSAGTLLSPDALWNRASTDGSLRLYDRYYYDYATLYRTQPSVRTCVDFIARNIAQLGLHVFRRVSETDRQRLRDHPLARLIARPLPPAFKVTRYRLIEAVLSDLGIYFNAYWLKIGTPESQMGLLRLPPPYVKVEGGLMPTRYILELGRERREFSPEQVVHFRGFSAESCTTGLSPLETLRRILAEEHAMGDYREGFWQNSARMNGIVERPMEAPEWSQEARERFRAELQALYSGAGNSGRTAILEEGMQWKSMSFNAQESEYLGARKLTREECARAYHIPLPMVGILDHATFCLPGESLVATQSGPVPISEVQAGDWVWSYDREANGLSLFPVRRAQCTGYKPVLTIRTQNRTIRCTENHPMLRRSRWQKNETPHPNRRRYEHALDWIQAGKLLVGDIIVTVNELPDVGGDTCPTRHVSEGFAEFCGLLLGDGCIAKTRTGGTPSGVRIARAAKAAYMDHYREVMRAEFEQRDGAISLEEADRETRFASTRAAQELVALGLDGTAHTKMVPAWVFRLNAKLRGAFLRGFLDADGSVDKKGRISYSSCNERMLRQVRELCITIGVPVTNIRCQEGETTLPNGERCAFSQWTFTCSDPGANRERIGSHDPCYNARLATGKPFGRYYEYPERTGKVGIEPPAGCGYARIVAIETSEIVVPVYDLEIEDAHSFIAEGLVVHNSNIKEQHKNLYQDALGPWLAMIEQDIELQLLGDFPDSNGVYVEFNIQEKLAGSFEEQTASLQSAVGAPYMTRNEARARMNLPSVPGGERLVTPLNVIEGGQASPRDSAPKGGLATKALGAGAKAAELDASMPRLRTRHEEKWRELLVAYFRRQERALASRAGRGAASIETIITDPERWDRELYEDLYRMNVATATVWARRVADLVEGDLNEERMQAWLSENARISSEEINDSTAAQLADKLLDSDALEAVRHVFEIATTARATEIAVSKVTTAANFGAQEGAKQAGFRTKTWVVNSSNPRSAHAAMAGETVPIGQRFSNGANFPGDPVLGADGVAGCQCSCAFGW